MKLSEGTLRRVEESIKSSDDFLKFAEAMKLQEKAPKGRFWEYDGFFKFLAGGAGALVAAALLFVSGVFDVMGKTHAAQTRLLDAAEQEFASLSAFNEQLIFTSRAFYACNFPWVRSESGRDRKELREVFNTLTKQYNAKLTTSQPLPYGDEGKDYSMQMVLFSDGSLWYRVFISDNGSSNGRDDRAEDGKWELTDSHLELILESAGSRLTTLKLDRAEALDFAKGFTTNLMVQGSGVYQGMTLFNQRSCGHF